MQLPILVYDGACSFCVKNVLFLEKYLCTPFIKKSFREPHFFDHHPELTQAVCEKEIVLILPGDRLFYGAEAAFKLISMQPYLGCVMFVYRMPVLRQFWDMLYRNISRYRFNLRYWGS